MHVHCTHCGRQIPADDLNISTGIAKCGDCHAVFSFADALDTRSEAGHAPRRDRQPVPMPPAFREENRGGGLRIVRRWFALHFVFLLFFCIAWDAFLVFWYSIVASERDVPWIMSVFPIAHVAVGIGLTYYTLCGFIDSTVVELDGFHLRIHHGPLPWAGNRTIAGDRIKQLYCKQRTRQSKHGVQQRYELHAVTADGADLKLLSGLDEPDQALYLEQRFEQSLGIENLRVRGEYGG
jgi:hypothetical protein